MGKDDKNYMNHARLSGRIWKQVKAAALELTQKGEHSILITEIFKIEELEIKKTKENKDKPSGLEMAYRVLARCEGPNSRDITSIKIATLAECSEAQARIAIAVLRENKYLIKYTGGKTRPFYRVAKKLPNNYSDFQKLAHKNPKVKNDNKITGH